MEKRIFVYDLETFASIFTATFVDKDSNDTYRFVISEKKDERDKLFEFLETKVLGLIGYNCIHFDSQILEYLYRYPNCSVTQIAKYSSILVSENNRFPDVPEYKLRIKHLDLFRALSLSVKAKRTGLKWCEYMMDLDNIEDIPTQGEGDTWEEKVLDYNYNDVISTKELYLRNKKEIELRQNITKKEGVNVLNSTEPDISKKLFLHWLSKAMNISKNDLRNMGTDRKWIKVRDIIFSYIKFKTEKLQEVKKSFEELLLHPGSKFEKEVIFGGIKTTFALGGLHGSVENKLVKSDDKYIIKSADVKI